MDSDCLIKLSRVSVKEALVNSLDAVICPEVEHETARPALAIAHPESNLIRRNIAAGKMEMASAPAAPLEATELDLRGLGAGERGAIALYSAGEVDAIASDDRRLLRLLASIGVPAITSSTLLVMLWRRGALDAGDARAKLELLAPEVSAGQYETARRALESG